MKKYNLLINDIKTPVFTLADLEANARTVSQRADSSMHRVVRLYYLTRYLVVQYETLFRLIPIQVWNEYRNALDHYIRHITDAGSGHVKSMEGHFQRALLDICKLHCHGVGDLFVKRYKEIDGKALTLVDNGNFAGSVRAAQDAANAMFMRAKVIDLALGDDAQQNDEVLSTIWRRRTLIFHCSKCFVTSDQRLTEHIKPQRRSNTNRGRSTSSWR